jgi:plasmid stabilization system protein ParE
MALDLYYSQSFRRDIARLTGYLTKAAGEQTANAFAIRLKTRCEGLPHAPGKGTPYGRRQDVCKINEGPYKIFYRVTDSEIVILRLWDGRRGTEPYLPRK